MRRTFSSALLAPLAFALVATGCARTASTDGAATASAPASTPAAAPAVAAAPGAAAVRLPAGVTPAMVALGDSLFNAGSCQRCHGQKGVGARNAPSLLEGPWQHHKGTYAEIVATITTGIPKTAFKDTTRPFAMNPRGGPMNLTDDQVKAVAAYVFTITRARK